MKRLSAGGSGKAQLFANINEVTKVLSTGDAMDAATVWFSADPQPQGLWIGRWADTDVATSLEAGAAPSVAATVAPLDSSNGTFTVSGTTVTTNLAATTTYATIAAAIQTQIVAIGGVFSGATFTFAGGRFLLSLAGADELDPPISARLAPVPTYPPRLAWQCQTARATAKGTMKKAW